MPQASQGCQTVLLRVQEWPVYLVCWLILLFRWSFLNCLYWVWLSFVALAVAAASSFDLQLLKNTSLWDVRCEICEDHTWAGQRDRDPVNFSHILLPKHLQYACVLSCLAVLPKRLWADIQPQEALPVLRQLRNLEECLQHRQSCITI